MKISKCFLSLMLLSSVSLTSCGHYPLYEYGSWENQEVITFTEANRIVQSLKVTITQNEEQDFVYSEFDRWSPDGGEYIAYTDFIIYVYVDNVLLYDLYPYTNVDGFIYQATYVYIDGYVLDIQLTFNEATKRKESYFDARLWLTPYRNDDPYTFDRSLAERCTPSYITLYKL